MIFTNESERMKHLQASLIPQQYWDAVFLFNGKISELTLEMMKMDKLQVLTSVRQIKEQKLKDYNKISIWLAIAWSHPELKDNDLHHIMKELAITHRLEAASLLGRKSYFDFILGTYEKIRIDRDRIVKNFRYASLGPHLPVMQDWISKLPQSAHADAVLEAPEALNLAVQKSGLDVLNFLLDLVGDQLQELEINDAFNLATRNGRLDVLKRFKELLPENIEDMVAYDEYQAIQGAAQHGDLNVVKWLMEQLPEAKRVEALEADDFQAFCLAAENGHLGVMEYFFELAPTQILTMIKAQKYSAFQSAALNGHWSTMERLMQLAPAHIQNMIEENDFQAFSFAALNGHWSVMEHLIQLVPANKVDAMIKSNGKYIAFVHAASNGQFDVFERLIERLTPTDIQLMLKYENYKVFRVAAENGHRHILERLIKLSDPNSIHDMIGVNEYEPLRVAIRNKHTEAVDYLHSFDHVFSRNELEMREHDSTLRF